MLTLFCYDDQGPGEKPSIFLAGPTSKGFRTRWRLEAVGLLEARGFSGEVIIPEFRDRPFHEAVESRFGGRACPIPGMRPTTHGILEWETEGIERASCVLFWMPFVLHAEDDLGSLPGFTTRAEVGRELARAPWRIALGMPDEALSGGHIRYHAHLAGVPVHGSLEATVDAALAKL